MSESLLSFSEVLLFGRPMEDILVASEKEVEVRVVIVENIDLSAPLTTVDGQNLVKGNSVLLAEQGEESGVYKIKEVGGQLKINQASKKKPRLVRVKEGENFKDSVWKKKKKKYKKLVNKGAGNNQLDYQIGKEKAKFARIYGFSYEGTYFDLPSPAIFLVHGDGEVLSEYDDDDAPEGTRPSKPSRAPRSPEFGGLVASDFQFADDIRVWSYDKADYTVRMDVATGMFEQVLLEPTFYDVDVGVSGAKVSGAKVSGAKVSGAKVSGAKVSGAKVSGAKARGPSD